MCTPSPKAPPPPPPAPPPPPPPQAPVVLQSATEKSGAAKNGTGSGRKSLRIDLTNSASGSSGLNLPTGS